MDEIEALEAIYGPDMVATRPAPKLAGEPTGCLSINIIPSLSAAAGTAPVKWAGQLKLKFDMTAGYPDNELPVNKIA